MCLVSFMHKLCQVFAEYFKEVEEESIRDNFVIVYELLDEVMDYGSPQFTDSKVFILTYAQFQSEKSGTLKLFSNSIPSKTLNTREFFSF